MSRASERSERVHFTLDTLSGWRIMRSGKAKGRKMQKLTDEERNKIEVLGARIIRDRTEMESKYEEKLKEEVELAEAYKEQLVTLLDERELRLIRNCLIYSDNDPAGLPGHNIMIVVSKLAEDLGIDMLMIDYALGNMDAKDYVLGSEEAMDRLHD